MADRPATMAALGSSRWQMLAEFLPVDADGHEQIITVQLEALLLALALPPEQRRQVQNALTETLHQLSARRQGLTVTAPVCIRIYRNHHPTVSATSEPLPASTAEIRPIAVDAGSWGFFLVEKLVAETTNCHYLIDLYLYTERR